MENARARLVRYLQDAHAAEVGIRKMLEGFVNDTEDQNLKMLYQEHIQITRTQEDRLEQCLHKYNEKPSDGKGIMNTIMAKAGEVMQVGHDSYDKATQNLIKAYATEHLECAMYEALIAYANEIGDNDVVMVAQSIMEEEKMTAERIFPMISRYAVAVLGGTSAKDSGGSAYPA